MAIHFEQILTAIVAGIFAAWFVGSVINQFRFKWWRRITRFDRLNLLPKWTFFAPNPGRDDYHIVYRNWVNDTPGAWQEIFSISASTRWRWLWNPLRYPNKAVSDLVGALNQTRHANREEPRAVVLSVPYISLLTWIMAQAPSAAGISHRQFALIATRGFGEARELNLKYVSEVHHVDA